MKATDRFVLPSDVELIPVQSVDHHLRMRLEAVDDDVIVTRRQSRSTSQLIDAAAADLIVAFREPVTIVDAVIRFAQARSLDADTVLVDAFPLISNFVEGGLLTSERDERAAPVVPLLEPGEHIGDAVVAALVQVLPDSEVWRGQLGSTTVAIKVARTALAEACVRREAAALASLDGEVGPRLMATYEVQGRLALVTSWIEGRPFDNAVRTLREQGARGRRVLVELVGRAISALASVHARGIAHADVHPRNFIVTAGEDVKVLDYGLSVLPEPSAPTGQPGRGAVGHFVEPEYARALLADEVPPAATMQSDQYSIAVMTYRALTSEDPIDLALDRRRSWRQIAFEDVRPFVAVGHSEWPAVELVLRRALSKDPRDRFPSVADFGAAFGLAAATRPVARRSRSRNTVLEAVVSTYGDLSRGDVVLLAPRASLNYGAAGIAYALLRIATAREDAALLAAADVWVARAAADTESAAFEGPDIGLPSGLGRSGSLFHGAGGVAFAQALVASALGSRSQASLHAAEFAGRGTPGAVIDATLGEASALLGAAGLIEALPDHPATLGDVHALGDRIAIEIRNRAATLGAIRDGSIRYLGYAHGWAGVLHATMRWHRAVGTPYPADLSARAWELSECARRRRGKAWLPVEADSASWDAEPWPGWCHGSAGHLIFALAAAEALAEPRFLDLAVALGRHVADIDDRKVGQLCCGLAGQAYALAALGRRTGEGRWARAATVLAERAAAVVQAEPPHRRGSLYKGDVGVALLVSDLEAGNGFPLVEPEA